MKHIEGEWHRSNIEYFGTAKEGRRKVVQDTLPTAYNFVHNQIRALRAWDQVEDQAGRGSREWSNDRVSLDNFSSHYNGVYSYMGDAIIDGIESLPGNERYNQLFKSTKSGYRDLERKSMRFVFEGERVLDREDVTTSVPVAEVHRWIVEHSARPDGLIEGASAGEVIPNRFAPEVIEDAIDLVHYFMRNNIGDKDGQWVHEVSHAYFRRFPKETQQLAVRKLACGMAVVDLLTQESAQLGMPVSGDYRPPQEVDEEGIELPPLQEVWDQGQGLLAALADPKDELLAGLFDNAFVGNASESE